MKELKFRTLNANEIECRVGSVAKSGNGFFLLLYKNARVDQCILDETVGQFNWQCRYYQVKNTMICSVAINVNYNDENKEPMFLFKDNGGDDDFQAEQVKGELSDAFKRACFNWGIGRELYYSPKIWVNANDSNTTKDRYVVKTIEYDDKKRITDLTIVNDKTNEVVFLYKGGKKTSLSGENQAKTTKEVSSQEPLEIKGSINPDDLDYINRYIEVLTREESKKNFFEWLDKNYNTMNPEMLTYSQGDDVVKKLSGRVNRNVGIK